MDYTKGQWQALDSRHVISRQDKQDIDICTTHTLSDIGANAHLIAAAPDLYEALKRINTLVESGDWQLPEGFCESEVNYMKLALAKAEEK